MTPAHFSVDPYLSKTFKRNEYNCFDLVRDVWEAITGEDISKRLMILQTPHKQRRARASDLRAFQKLEIPEDPCLVMLRASGVDPHIGVFIRKRILHLTEKSGVLFQQPHLVYMGFQKVAFYK